MRILLRAGQIATLFLLSISASFAQDNVGIGTANPRSTALLDLFSTDKGLLVPRVDTTGIFAGLGALDHGMVVYDTVVGDLFVWDGTKFLSLSVNVGDTARWGVSGNDIYSLNSGNVGIGTSTPSASYKMDVVGGDIQVNGIRFGRGTGGVANNLAIGQFSLNNNPTGGLNIAIGSNSLQQNTSGLLNIAIGTGTLIFSTTGSSNTIVGHDALRGHTTSNQNTAMGEGVMRNGNSGNGNTALGYYSLRNSTGNSNSAIGINSGIGLTGGANNSFLGSNSDAGTGTLNNATAVGANTIVGADNSLVLGNGAAVGIGTSIPNQNASLDLGENDKGLQLNRVDTTSLTLGASDHGMVVYDTLENKLFVWNGTAWESATDASAVSTLQSAYDAGQTINMNSGDIDFISSGANSLLYLDEANEKVAIGTTSPIFGILNVHQPDVLTSPEGGNVLTVSGASSGPTGSIGINFFSTNSANDTNQASIFLKNFISTDKSMQFTNNNQSAIPTTIMFRFLDNTAAPILSLLNSGNVGIGTEAPINKFQVTGDAARFDSLIIENGAQAGYVLTSADGTGAASWQPVGATSWDLLGNAGTINGTNFIGTTDNVPLSFRFNNLPSGKLDGISTSLGQNSLSNLTTGIDNTAIGISALQTNGVGIRNTAVGKDALQFNTSGASNTGIGYQSLNFNTIGVQNTATGYQSLQNNINGSNNTANGTTALYQNTTGSDNTATGFQALILNTVGINNTADGTWALENNISGNNNTSIGYRALNINTTGSDNTAIGANANVASPALTNATAIGSNAIVNASNEIQLGAVGTAVQIDGPLLPAGAAGTAGQVLTSAGPGLTPTWATAASAWGLTGNAGTIDGTNYLGTTDDVPLNFLVNNVRSGRIDRILVSTFFGYNSGQVNAGIGNTGFGDWALTQNTSGVRNTALGGDALTSNTIGNFNTATGTALTFNTTGNDNTATGNQSLYVNTTGQASTAVGSQSLLRNTVGSLNTAMGYGALSYNVGGSNGTAFGVYALGNYNNTSTPHTNTNTAVGYQSIYGSFTQSLNTGLNNTAVGYQTLIDNTSGTGNTALGYFAGYTTTAANANTTGSNNTFIGYNSGPDSPTQLSNATAIGSNAKVNASNALVLGGTGANAVNVGIGTTTPNTSYQLTTTTGTGGLGGIRIENTYTGASSAYGSYTNVTAVGTGQRYGEYLNVLGAAGNASDIYGSYSYVNHLGSGTSWGNFISNASSGTGVAVGQRIAMGTGGTNVNYGQFIYMGNTSSATNYAIYIDHPGLGSGTEYGIYSAGEDYNFFSGNVGIGVISPSRKLEVNDNTSNATVAEISVELSGVNSSVGGTKGLLVSVSDNASTQSTGIEARVGGTALTTSSNAIDAWASGTNTALNKGVVAAATNSSSSNYAFHAYSNGNVGTNYGYVATINGTQANPKYAFFSIMGGNGTKYGTYISGEDNNYFSGNMGIGTTSPTGKFEVIGQNGEGALLINDTDVMIGDYTGGQFGTHLIIDPEAVGNFQFLSGNVGIGTTSPVNKLDVEGGVAIGATYSGTSTAPTNGLLVQGNVGIGTTAPVYSLDVNGTVRSSGTNYGFRHLNAGVEFATYVEGTAGWLGTVTNHPVYFYANNSGALAALATNGNFGIGQLNPVFKLEVNGSAAKPGGGAWSATSDRRAKKEINDFDDGLNELLQINPVQFKYNSQSGHSDTTINYVGVIAQEIQKILPYTVNEVENELIKNKLTFDGSSLTYVIINAIKEQQAIIDSQKAEIKELKTDQSNTQSQVDELKAQMQQIIGTKDFEVRKQK